MHAEEATSNEKISTDPHVTTGANDYLGERDKLFSELFETLGKSNESLSSQQDGSNNGIFSRLFRSNAVNDKERMLLPKTPTENEIEDESFVVDMRINKFWPMITALVLFGFYLSIWSLYELLIVRRILGYCLLLFIAVLTTLISYVLMRGIDPLLKDLSTVKRGKYTVLYLVSLGLTLRLAGDSTILDFTLSVAQMVSFIAVNSLIRPRGMTLRDVFKKLVAAGWSRICQKNIKAKHHNVTEHSFMPI